MLPRIRDISDWKHPPLYISPPRIPILMGTTYVSAPYIGISYIFIDGFEKDGEVFWTSSTDARSLILDRNVKHIYCKDGNGSRYKNIIADDYDLCKDCKGTGIYIGLLKMEICKTCNGNKIKL